MIALVQWVKREFPFIWGVVERVNGFCVRMLLSGRLSKVVDSVESHDPGDGFAFREAVPADLEACVRLLASLSQQDVRNFRPFVFDRRSVQRVMSCGSYLVFVATREGSEDLGGLFFLRVFFYGKAFLGFCVSENARGRGLGGQMVKVLHEGAGKGRLDLYSTVSSDNEPSIKAHLREGAFTVTGRLPGGFLLLRRDGTHR